MVGTDPKPLVRGESETLGLGDVLGTLFPSWAMGRSGASMPKMNRHQRLKSQGG